MLLPEQLGGSTPDRGGSATTVPMSHVPLLFPPQAAGNQLTCGLSEPSRTARTGAAGLAPGPARHRPGRPHRHAGQTISYSELGIYRLLLHRAFFDTVPWDLVLKAVARHISPGQEWILLYVERWLKAPLRQQDGTLVTRDRGTPQGSAISPLIANLFMHYAFDTWLARECPGVQFERYCDDVVVHCASEEQARHVRDAIAERLAHLGLELHPGKTRVVYCKDDDRRGDHEVTSFTFLGYEFRPRLAKNRHGKHFVSFLPAVSTEAMKAMGAEIRSWHWAKRSDKSLGDLALMFNSKVQGWINYYGRFYRSRLLYFLRRLNDHLVRWACRKYDKRLRNRERRAMELLAGAARRSPRLFAHWRLGARPDGWAMGAG